MKITTRTITVPSYNFRYISNNNLKNDHNSFSACSAKPKVYICNHSQAKPSQAKSSMALYSSIFLCSKYEVDILLSCNKFLPTTPFLS